MVRAKLCSCHKDKMDSRRESTGRRGSNVNNINSSWSSSTKSSDKITSSSFFGSPSTALPIWHQQQYTPQSFSPPSSATSIHNAAFCRSDLRRTIQRHNVRSFYLRSVRHSLISAKPTSFLLRDAHAGTPLILIADSHHPNTVQQQRRSVRETPSTCAPDSITNAPSNTYVAKATASPLPAKN